MKNCENNGHKYYPAVRRVTSTTWLGPITTREENILYCARCANVKLLDIDQSGFRSSDFALGTLTTTGYSFTWNVSNNTPDPL